jgi:hypothetical protein
MPAKAGIQFDLRMEMYARAKWIPACAGMTPFFCRRVAREIAVGLDVRQSLRRSR